MNFLESVGSLTLIFGAIYLYFSNKDKQADKQRKLLRPNNQLAPNTNAITYAKSSNSHDEMSNHNPNRLAWLEILNDESIPSEFKKIVHSYLLPYQINAADFFVNSNAMDNPSAYVLYEDNKKFSATLLRFLIDPGLKAAGYPFWFYAAFPDVAMWAINGEGNKLFNSKYSHYTELELLDPESKKRFSDKILTDMIDLYISAGNRLECQ